MSQALRFIRKNGRIIPIRAPGGGASSSAHHVAKHLAHGAALGAAGVAVAAIKKPSKNQTIKVNRGLDLAGLGLSVASGALAAATFSTPKGLAFGHAAAKAIDVAGVSANVASVAGRGNIKQRAKQAAKQEVRNFAIGNTVFALGVLGVKKNRKALAGYAAKILQFGRKAVGAG